MTQSYYSIITNNGLLKEAAARISGASQVNLTHLAVGDSNGTSYNPNGAEIALVHETYRTALTHVAIDENNPNQLIVEAVINETIGPFYIREVGIFDADGDLFAIGKFPETFKPNLPSGSGKRLYIRMILGFSNSPQVNLIISDDINNDPNFATNINNALATKLVKTANLSDLANPATARDNLGLKNGSISDFTGAVMAFAMSTPPTGWLECYGAAVLVSAYSALATAIYCGNTSNAIATWGYKCTNPLNPSGSRSISGQYIVIPDLRGEFIRGWDNGRNIDTGRIFGSSQLDALQNIIGNWQSVTQGLNTTSGAISITSNANVSLASGGDARGYANFAFNASNIARTSTETRSRNIALIYCIKY